MCRVKIGDSKADSSPHPTLFSQGIGRAPRNKPVPPFFVLQEQTYILRGKVTFLKSSRELIIEKVVEFSQVLQN